MFTNDPVSLIQIFWRVYLFNDVGLFSLGIFWPEYHLCFSMTMEATVGAGELGSWGRSWGRP